MAIKQQDYAKSIRQQHAQEKHRWTGSNNKGENDIKQASKAKLVHTSNLCILLYTKVVKYLVICL